MFYTLIKHGFWTNLSTRRVLSITDNQLYLPMTMWTDKVKTAMNSVVYDVSSIKT